MGLSIDETDKSSCVQPRELFAINKLAKNAELKQKEQFNFAAAIRHCGSQHFQRVATIN